MSSHRCIALVNGTLPTPDSVSPSSSPTFLDGDGDGDWDGDGDGDFTSHDCKHGVCVLDDDFPCPLCLCDPGYSGNADFFDQRMVYSCEYKTWLALSCNQGHNNLSIAWGIYTAAVAYHAVYCLFVLAQHCYRRGPCPPRLKKRSPPPDSTRKRGGDRDGEDDEDNVTKDDDDDNWIITVLTVAAEMMWRFAGRVGTVFRWYYDYFPYRWLALDAFLGCTLLFVPAAMKFATNYDTVLGTDAVATVCYTLGQYVVFGCSQAVMLEYFKVLVGRTQVVRLFSSTRLASAAQLFRFHLKVMMITYFFMVFIPTMCSLAVGSRRGGPYARYAYVIIILRGVGMIIVAGIDLPFFLMLRARVKRSMNLLASQRVTTLALARSAGEESKGIATIEGGRGGVSSEGGTKTMAQKSLSLAQLSHSPSNPQLLATTSTTTGRETPSPRPLSPGGDGSKATSPETTVNTTTQYAPTEAARGGSRDVEYVLAFVNMEITRACLAFSLIFMVGAVSTVPFFWTNQAYFLCLTGLVVGLFSPGPKILRIVRPSRASSSGDDGTGTEAITCFARLRRGLGEMFTLRYWGFIRDPASIPRLPRRVGDDVGDDPELHHQRLNGGEAGCAADRVSVMRSRAPDAFDGTVAAVQYQAAAASAKTGFAPVSSYVDRNGLVSTKAVEEIAPGANVREGVNREVG